MESFLADSENLGLKTTVNEPDSKEPLIIVGHEEKLYDFSVFPVNKPQTDNDWKIANEDRQNTYSRKIYPLNDNFIYYNCSSLKGTSGAMCFSLHGGARMLYAMHCGAVLGDKATFMRVRIPSVEYGVRISKVKEDIKRKISAGNAYLSIDQFRKLFPPEQMQTE